MLALDSVFQEPHLSVDALALWSASRLAFEQWRPALQRLRGVRVELRHGHADDNIAIDAAQALRDALVEGGADVRWIPFDGGHEIPLGAWTGLRRLVREMGDFA
jgi:phospholipase/carboxylesterase